MGELVHIDFASRERVSETPEERRKRKMTAALNVVHRMGRSSPSLLSPYIASDEPSEPEGPEAS